MTWWYLLVSILLSGNLAYGQGVFLFDDSSSAASPKTVRPSRLSMPAALGEAPSAPRNPRRKLPPAFDDGEPTPKRELPAALSDSAKDRRSEGRAPCPYCKTEAQARTPKIVYDQPVVSTAANMRTPIWQPFAKAFAQCAPGCQPIKVGIHREPDGRPSCHHSNRAIDVGGMVCNGQTYRATDEMRSHGRFSEMVACMKPKLKTLYKQSHRLHLGITLAHYDHVHFSIGCYGGTYQ